MAMFSSKALNKGELFVGYALENLSGLCYLATKFEK